MLVQYTRTSLHSRTTPVTDALLFDARCTAAYSRWSSGSAL